MTSASPVLEVRDLKKHYTVGGGFLGGRKGVVPALDGVSFSVARGETVSIVGESGCGKSTLAKLVMRIVEPTSGEVYLDGQRIDQLSAGRLRPMRQRLQMVFQDPFSSLNPRMRVGDLIAEPLESFGLVSNKTGRDARIAELLDQVRLPRDAANRFAHEFSGGQRQRIGIARALASKPELIVCDEAVSALDVSVKAQIVNLLSDLQDELGLALLFISHDLAIVQRMTHRIAVMYLGKIVEMGDRDQIFYNPQHPYTKALLSAVPVPDPTLKRDRSMVRGELNTLAALQTACPFQSRCVQAFDRCRSERPVLAERGSPGHLVSCHAVT